MTSEELLDRLDELLDKATTLPFSSGKLVIDGAQAREILQDIRLGMPNEIKQARAIVADRAEILDRAKRESEMTLRVAEEKAKALVARDEIVRSAQKTAADILSQANAKARELRVSTNDYIESSLKSCEEVLARSAGEVRAVRANVKKALQGGEGKP